MASGDAMGEREDEAQDGEVVTLKDHALTSPGALQSEQPSVSHGLTGRNLRPPSNPPGTVSSLPPSGPSEPRSGNPPKMEDLVASLPLPNRDGRLLLAQQRYIDLHSYLITQMHTFKEVQLDYEIQVSPATMPPQITLYVAVSFVCASLPVAVHPHVTIGAWKVRGRLWYSWISTLLREDSFYHEYYDVQLGPYGETNFRIYQRHFRSHIEYLRERLDHSSRLETLPRTEVIHATWNTLIPHVWDP